MPPALHPCAGCAELVPAHTCACPHCGARHPCASRALPAAALLLGLAASGCDGKGEMQMDYGIAFTDQDEDGWAAEDGDCDDEDASVNPDAEETPGDGVDSNCDGEDDT